MNSFINSCWNRRWILSAAALSLGLSLFSAQSVSAEPSAVKASAVKSSSVQSSQKSIEVSEASISSTGLPYVQLNAPEPSAAAAASSGESPNSLLPEEAAVNPDAPTYTMRQALEIAISNSPELESAKAAYEQAKGAVEEAYSDGNPTVNFSAGYVFTVPEAKGKMGDADIVIGHQHNYNVGLTINQVISTFGRLHYSVLSAQMSEYAALEDYRKALEAKWASTAEKYLNVLLAKEAVIIADEQVKLKASSLEQAQYLEEGGLAAHFDVLTMEAAKSAADVALIESKNALRLARAALCTEMGLPMGTEFNLVKPERSKIPKDVVKQYNLEESIKEAYARRPEVQSLRWAEEAAKARLELVRNSRNPILSLQSQVTNTQKTAMSSGTNWVTSVVLAVPVYDGGAEHAQSKQLEAAVRQLDAGLEIAKRGIRLDVEQCYYNLDSRWQRCQQSQISLKQAEEAYRVADIRYRAGLSTTTELLDAQSALVSAKRSVASALYSYVGANINWALATSGAYPMAPIGPIDVSDLKTDLKAWYIGPELNEGTAASKLIKPVKDDKIPSFAELKAQINGTASDTDSKTSSAVKNTEDK